MTFRDWIRGLFGSDDSPAAQDLRNTPRPADGGPAARPTLSSPVEAVFSEEERQRRLLRYVTYYQHHALRESALQMHPELVKGFNGADKHLLQFGLRHSWFKVPLMFGVEESMTKAKDYIAAIAHERHHIGQFIVHVLSMPKPERSPEAAFIAIAWCDGERPAYPHHSQTARYFTLEMMKDQNFVFCEWRQASHLNYGNAECSLAAFVGLVTEKLAGAGNQPVGTFDRAGGARLVGSPERSVLERRAKLDAGATPNPQTLLGAMEEYQRSSDAKRRVIMEWLAPRLAEKPDVAKVLDTIVSRYVEERFGPAGDQALARIAAHVKQFPSDPRLRQVLAYQMFLGLRVELPVADLKRDIEQKIPEWKKLAEDQANAETLVKYLELLSLMQELRIKLELTKIVLPVAGNA